MSEVFSRADPQQLINVLNCQKIVNKEAMLGKVFRHLTIHRDVSECKSPDIHQVSLRSAHGRSN